jgi:hypothetical protein
VKVGGVLGGHGLVVEVADPRREARLWRRALGLRELRASRREVVLGSVAFFVVLRRSTGAPRVAEVHVAVEQLEGRGLRADELGGRSRASDPAGVRLVVRQLTGPPARAWLPRRRRRSRR